MRKPGILPMILAGLMACGNAGDRDRPLERSPYGELEVARAEEVSPPVKSSAGARNPPPAAPVTPAPSGPDSTEPGEHGDPPGYAPDLPASAPDVGSPDSNALDTMVPEEPNPEPAVPESGVFQPAPTTGVRIVPAGTVIHAALEDSIHSRHDVSGKVVAAKVVQNVTGPDGLTWIPAGTPVQLLVTQVKPGRGDRKGVLEIRADSITIGGEPRKLDARLQPVPYELRGRGVTGEEAAKVGVGAAGGAVAGRVLGGDTRGAVIGGVVGAVGGAAVASETAAKDVVVKPRTPVVLVLTHPLSAGS